MIYMEDLKNLYTSHLFQHVEQQREWQDKQPRGTGEIKLWVARKQINLCQQQQ